MTALDPVYTIGDQIAETMVRHEGCSHKVEIERALKLLQLVKVPSAERRLKAYPHELCGGLRQLMNSSNEMAAARKNEAIRD